MITRACSISGCRNPYHSKGYCWSHYYRLLRHGDPLGGRTPDGEPMRFIHEVAIHHVGDECLIWPFGKNSAGYGTVRVDGKMVIATRYVCELVHGEPPTPEHQAAHSCGKGHEGCISPIHLSWKTPAENKADELIHGTRNRGERCGKSRLTEAEAREILALKGAESLRAIGVRFGVSRNTASQIHTGRTWAWLKEPHERETA